MWGSTPVLGQEQKENGIGHRENAREMHLPRYRREKPRAMVEGKLLIRARLNACLGSHFPCRSSPWPKEDEERKRNPGDGERSEEKWGGSRGWLELRETRGWGRGWGDGRDDETPTPAGEAGLMKSVCPVKVKINWRSGGGYHDNQPGPVVFKPSLVARPIAILFRAAIGYVSKEFLAKEFMYFAVQ